MQILIVIFKKSKGLDRSSVPKDTHYRFSRMNFRCLQESTYMHSYPKFERDKFTGKWFFKNLEKWRGLLGARDISGAIQNAERTWIWNQDCPFLRYGHFVAKSQIVIFAMDKLGSFASTKNRLDPRFWMINWPKSRHWRGGRLAVIETPKVLAIDRMV
jgi:hypothetical protein